MKEKKYSLNPYETMQPREKAIQYGTAALSDKELLKILIGSGHKGHNVDQIASELLKLLDREKELPEIKVLMETKGIGAARASLIAAALEFSRRLYLPTGRRIDNPADAYQLLFHMADRPQEYFFTISLNGAHEQIKTRQISQGLLNKTIVHPREVFSDPIRERAAAIIVAHNHPSGNLTPSKEDKNITMRLVSAGEILGIPVLDHIIFSQKGYMSFAQEKLL